MFRSNLAAALLGLPLVLMLFSLKGSCNDSKMKSNSPGQPQTEKLTGTWGGEGISLEITDAGANLTFDCAHGGITEEMTPDKNGKFAADGFFVRERGGPTRQGEDAKSSPATYAGSVNGDILTLRITLTQTKEQVGTFNLTHGKPGRIRRCL